MAKSPAYEAVYNQIVAAMEKGIIPWQKSWTGMVPKNAINGRAYNGVNLLLLGMTYHTDPRWLTYKQASSLGGQVRKGEKSMPVVFWKIFTKEEDGKKQTIPFLKYYHVFNVSQIDGLELPPLDTKDNAPNFDAEAVLSVYDGPVVKFEGSQPCYIPSLDVIKIPAIEHFNSSDEYYSTLFHEHVHGTGHESRLKRDLKGRYDKDSYSFEELVAEFGAAFLCNACGIDNTVENSTAYLQSWLKTFKNDPSMLVHAASKAQKASDYILGLNQPESTEEE